MGTRMDDDGITLDWLTELDSCDVGELVLSLSGEPSCITASCAASNESSWFETDHFNAEMLSLVPNVSSPDPFLFTEVQHTPRCETSHNSIEEPTIVHVVHTTPKAQGKKRMKSGLRQVEGQLMETKLQLERTMLTNSWLKHKILVFHTFLHVQEGMSRWGVTTSQAHTDLFRPMLDKEAINTWHSVLMRDKQMTWKQKCFEMCQFLPKGTAQVHTLEGGWKCFVSVWQFIVQEVNKLLLCMDFTNIQQLQPEFHTLGALIASMLALAAITPAGACRMWTLSMDTGTQGQPRANHWDEVLDGLNLSMDQRQQAMIAWDIYQQQISVLQAACKQVVAEQVAKKAGDRSPGAHVESAATLEANLQKQHHLLLILGGTFFRRILTAEQLLRCVLLSWPLVPDMFAILDRITACCANRQASVTGSSPQILSDLMMTNGSALQRPLPYM